MTELTVLAPGSLTTVQDLGRPGWAALGVGRSGAADLGSLRRANRLVGNVATAAVLETVLGGLRLLVDVGATVAATGTSATLRIGGRVHPTGAAVRWPAGAELVVDPPASGLRTYLAVRGGLDVTPVLGSRSRDTLARLGPEPLGVGDVLPVGSAVTADPARQSAVETPPGDVVTLDAGIGPRADWFDLGALIARTWQVGADLDRVGVRLLGKALDRRRRGELVSEGVVRGAVQVPPDGRPLVFGADHPTTGGYPVIAVLTDAASDRFAQVRPGTAIHFRLRR